MSISKLLDGWAIPHFLFGTVTATGAHAFGYPGLTVFWLTLGLAILWEIFEMWVKLREHLANSLMDIVLPLVAYWCTYVIVERVNIDPRHAVALFVIALLVYFFANFIAWQARLNRDHEFMG